MDIIFHVSMEVDDNTDLDTFYTEFITANNVDISQVVLEVL